jgi:hypothetical protein
MLTFICFSIVTAFSRISQRNLIVFSRDVVESDDIQIGNASHQFCDEEIPEFLEIAK